MSTFILSKRAYNIHMINLIRNTTELAMHFVSLYVHPGDTVVDATCGNGKDTIALAQMKPGKLYCFDIQAQAIEKTRETLIQEQLYDERVTLICDSHANLEGWIEEPSIKAFVFNLGYLPSADKTLTTKKDSTLAALKSALSLLQSQGLICLTLYSGHAGGSEEKDAVLSYVSTLDSRKYHVLYLNMINQPKHPPEIVLITGK